MLAVAKIHDRSLVLPARTAEREDPEKAFVQADPPAQVKPDPRIQAEVDRFLKVQEDLRKEYIPTLFNLAAEKAVPGGLKELDRRRQAVTSAFDKLEQATTEKWPLDIDRSLKAIENAALKLRDLFDATGGKPIKDKEVIERFRKEFAEAVSKPIEEVLLPEGGLTLEFVRGLVISEKVKLYRLEQWKDFEFEAAAVSGLFGWPGNNVTFSAEVPEAAREVLRKDPNLKERRDKAIQQLHDRHGGHFGALLAIDKRLETYKNVKGVFDAYARFSQARELLVRAEVQVTAALNTNAKDWVQGDSYPAFKAAQQEFMDKRGKALEELKLRVAAVEEKIRKEESQKRRN